ncbi:MAG: hypothetical protein B6242_05015 [Anaerolineaceae bacterium 4572_78]|nr:MAG: hypothetical protein B6242_05015 [Anaerolineaceae bacterium 4572_78]
MWIYCLPKERIKFVPPQIAHYVGYTRQLDWVKHGVLKLLHFLMYLIIGMSSVSLAQSPANRTQWGQLIQLPSPGETSVWFPDLTVDSKGNVHVIWCETDHFEVMEYQANVKGKAIERVLYSKWNGDTWTSPIILVSPEVDIIRNSISIDENDQLHVLFDNKVGGGAGLLYKNAPADKSNIASAWSKPHLVNSRQGTYFSDIVPHDGAIHILYDDRGGGTENDICQNCADVFYRQSPDGGKTWQSPVNLVPSPIGSGRGQIEVDSGGVIHVTWDEGWDRLTDFGEHEYGIYLNSRDGGQTWSSATEVWYPNRNNVQFAVAGNGKGGVMLVWRNQASQFPDVYYMWSTDYGETWSFPDVVPNLSARRWNSPFDLYDMAEDSAGTIHFVLAAFYGNFPSSPDARFLYDGNGYPEFPHIFISNGNKLHVTWFVRADSVYQLAPHVAWYQHGISDAPSLDITSAQFKGNQTTEITATLTPTATPIPDIAKGSVNTNVPDPNDWKDDVIRLLIGLSPAILFFIVVIVRVMWIRK